MNRTAEKNLRGRKKSQWTYGRPSTGSRIFDCCNVAFMILLMVITVYPFLYVLFASLSEPLRLYSHRGFLIAPLGFSLKGYHFVLNYRAIWNGYAVTIFLATVGTACTLITSLLFAYVLSKTDSMLHGFFTFAAVFTMYFNGGMIPKLESCMHAISAGVNRVHILDGRIPHCLLLEIFTNKGIGTAIQRDEEEKYSQKL